jgi:hypothetical protein
MPIAMLTHGFASSPAQATGGVWDGKSPHSVICFDSIISSLNATVNPNDVELLLDLMTTTFWEMPMPGGTISATVAGKISYVGLGPGSWNSSGATIEVYVTSSTATRTLVGEASARPSHSPLLFTFDEIDAVLVEIVIVLSVGPLSMTVLTAGPRIDLPKTPDVGYMPGFLNNLDEVTDSETEGNAFGVSRTVPRGWEENAPYSDLEMAWIREKIPPLIAHKGSPLFFAWNVEEYPYEIIFGRFDLAAITYNNVLHGGINLTVRGVI